MRLEMTIELDLWTVLVAAISSVISILGSAWVTWYFSKRHYAKTPRPITENDITMRDNGNIFRFAALFITLPFLLLVIAMLTGNCE